MLDAHEILTSRWFVQANDLIGGWCIMFEDKLPSESYCYVGDFMSQEIAEHIVALHNAML